ncbi:uncharacterized protein IUM83_05927 [Phytophthora cinnamomi]|uniref:uncharacterized protein n=1 Tax=Phytophthora cinnamomi TaxID=4785 RepID=UPI0035597E93|nr:hypothetical protein IUM83_05927 [Phytophthora cinnamomi]
MNRGDDHEAAARSGSTLLTDTPVARRRRIYRIMVKKTNASILACSSSRAEVGGRLHDTSVGTGPTLDDTL